MNALTRFDRMDDLFGDFFRRFARPWPMAVDTPAEIRLDITEHDKEYVVRAEIPGAKRDDIRVQIDGNTVSISAEVKKEQETREGRTLVKETSVGSAMRGFSLAHEIDDKSAVAKLEDGVLKLTLPKRQGASSRLLAVE